MWGLVKSLSNTLLILFAIDFIQFAQTAYLNCYNGTMLNPQTTPLESPLPLIENSLCINKLLKTVFFVFGLNGSDTGPATTAIVTGYISKGNVNILVLDWSEEASIGNLGELLGYGKATANAQKVGEQFANSLLVMVNAGLDLDKIHIVGHSLGAQLAGITGNAIQTKRGPVGRITGLDPARPLFQGIISIPNKLNPDSATFVDIVHSNPGGYGIDQSKGTVDFWPNYKGGKGVQPGCPDGNYPLLSEEGICSHQRSWMLFRESILDGDSFPAAGEPDYDTWIKNNGTTDQIAYLGEYVSLQAKGNFYLNTNGQSPYGMGETGTRPNNNETVV